VSHKPHAIFHTGDIVRSGDQWEQWEHHLNATNPWQAGTPIMYTLGNHDDDGEGDGALYNQVFALPRNSASGVEDYWFVTLGDAIVVGLSTQTFKGGAYAFQEQSDWLDQVLTQNPRTWKFVFFHHPIYTASLDIGFADVGHPPNEQDQNAALLPVFDKHHVDFVLYGHNHFYERFAPMVQSGDLEHGQVVGDANQGTTYVVTGGAGAFTYVVGMAILCGITPGSQFCSGNHHFVEVEITGKHLAFTVRQTKAQILGTSDSNAAVLEFLEYVKPGVDECAVVEPPVEVGPEPVEVAEVVEETAAWTEAEIAAEPATETSTETATIAEVGSETSAETSTETATGTETATEAGGKDASPGDASADGQVSGEETGGQPGDGEASGGGCELQLARPGASAGGALAGLLVVGLALTLARWRWRRSGC
jgi:predicted phosphodiesterase